MGDLLAAGERAVAPITALLVGLQRGDLRIDEDAESIVAVLDDRRADAVRLAALQDLARRHGGTGPTPRHNMFLRSLRRAGYRPDEREAALDEYVLSALVEAVQAVRNLTPAEHKTRSVFDRYHIVALEDLRLAAARVVARTTPNSRKRHSGT